MAMPIYEYACRGCSADFEELVSLSAAEAVRCPSCGSTRVEKQLSSFQRVRAGGGAAAPALAGAPARSGGCCGGGCGCGH
jgi:putative FmdB family regulatory protein